VRRDDEGRGIPDYTVSTLGRSARPSDDQAPCLSMSRHELAATTGFNAKSKRLANAEPLRFGNARQRVISHRRRPCVLHPKCGTEM
jgi:hypothetical protein